MYICLLACLLYVSVCMYLYLLIVCVCLQSSYTMGNFQYSVLHVLLVVSLLTLWLTLSLYFNMTSNQTKYTSQYTEHKTIFSNITIHETIHVVNSAPDKYIGESTGSKSKGYPSLFSGQHVLGIFR